MKKPLIWLSVLMVLATLGASLALGWFATESFRARYSAAGGPDPFWTFGIIDVSVGLCVLSEFVIGCIFVLIQKARPVGLLLVFCAVIYTGGCVGRHAVFGNPQREALMQAGQRMMPLVNSIEAYHRDYGAYPTNLDVLVPKYLDNLPSTGMASYTNYTYEVGSGTSYEGNPWVIKIPVGYGMGFDCFYYFPLQNYPDSYQSQRVERIGKWAIVYD